MRARRYPQAYLHPSAVEARRSRRGVLLWCIAAPASVARTGDAVMLSTDSAGAKTRQGFEVGERGSDVKARSAEPEDMKLIDRHARSDSR